LAAASRLFRVREFAHERHTPAVRATPLELERGLSACFRESPLERGARRAGCVVYCRGPTSRRAARSRSRNDRFERLATIRVNHRFEILLPDPAPTFLGLPGPLWQSLGLTLRLAAITTLVLGILGLPLAHWLNTTRRRLAPAIETLVALPIVLPPTVIGFYLLVAFSPNHAPGSWWRALTGAPLAFSVTGLVIASVFYSLPFAVQPFQAALRGVPRELLDAGAALGATPARVFVRLHAPLAWRGIAAGLTLGFAHTLGEFGVVLMIGGSIPGVTKVASIALYDEVQALAYPQAHAFAAALLVLSFGLLLVVTLLQRRRV
jgi:molybdate transport system permease protein